MPHPCPHLVPVPPALVAGHPGDCPPGEGMICLVALRLMIVNAAERTPARALAVGSAGGLGNVG